MITYYKVGGCVRDELLGFKSKDIDYAVEAPSYESMRDDLINKGTIIWLEKPEYFAIRGKHPQFGDVDFVLCRKDGYYSDNRRPDSVEPGTIYDDLARRDFTINAIAQREDGTLIDPHNGRRDLERNMLRCVGNAEDRFDEDPLRMLRAVRFHIVRGFGLDDEINYRLVLDGDKLQSLPLERVYEELYKCFHYDSWKTMQFFNQRPYLSNIIFKDMGLTLLPHIKGK